MDILSLYPLFSNEISVHICNVSFVIWKNMLAFESHTHKVIILTNMLSHYGFIKVIGKTIDFG